MNPVVFVAKAIRALLVPKYRFSALSRLGFYNYMSDREYLQRLFKYRMGRELDIDTPRTFSEKLQWLKIYNRRPEYSVMVDKYAVKKFVADKIGAEYVVPLIGVYESPDEIDFDSLPDKFVIKCTHNGGEGNAICRDKAAFDFESRKKVIRRALTKNYYPASREWPYKNVPPRVIVEQYIQDGDRLNLPVYKIFCFNGEPKLIQAIQDDKTKQETIDYFDTEWNRLQLRQNYPNSKNPLPRPECLSEMLELAAKLSTGVPHVRVDLYQANGKVYFSEFTFFSDAGMVDFDPPEWNNKLGEWLILPEKHNVIY